MSPDKTPRHISQFQSSLIFLTLLLLFSALVPFTAAGQATTTDQPANAVQVQMRNVTYHFTDTLSAYVKTLRGEVVPTGDNKFPTLDDKNSYDIRVTSAEMVIAADSLAKVLDSYVFATHSSPLKDVSMSIDKGRLKIKGRLHDKGDAPFETSGSLSPTPDGKIRLHAEKIRALHLPVKGLMDVLGIDLADLIKAGKMPGITADGDDMIMDLGLVLPPPHIQGKITAVRIEGQNLVEVIGDPAKTDLKHVAAANYMAYWGNQLRFGKLTMADADIILIDMNPEDPFDFDLDHYKDQLVPGYTKITATFGLRVYVKDFNKVHPAAPAKTETKK
jgi:hypothetical protein